MFVTACYLLPKLVFESKAGAYQMKGTCGASISLPANTRLERKLLAATNVVAYSINYCRKKFYSAEPWSVSL